MTNGSFQSAIIRWYEENGRSLPWRETRDPYAIWLSEIILQQTRIAQGTDYWHRFMRRWPTVETLADATEDEVLKEWQGLGYYSRARNLHAAAQQMKSNGGFPRTYEGIRALKGVGDYTAAAIASIAFDLPHAAVDGNVYRVLSRYFGIATPINSTGGKKEFQQLADQLLPRSKAAAWNQALMDFGALQCTPQSPRCLLCPLQESCHALRTGHPEELPVKERKLKRRERFFTYYLLRNNDLTALHQRGAGDIWQGLWEPVLKEDPFPKEEAEIKHVLTHQTLYARMIAAEATSNDLPEGYQWVALADIADHALPRLVEKLLEERLPERP